MDNQEKWLEQIDKRLDNLERKLDEFLKLTIEHDSSLNWIKGYIKLSILGLGSLIGIIITGIIKLINN